jgi:hypothetical protein
MFTLPNGKPIDSDMIEIAMEDGDLGNSYYLNTQTGEVTFLSAFADTMEEDEKRAEEIETSHAYIPIERISSHEAYQWMEQFVTEIVAPKDAQAAEKLSIALMGKGAFRRFKDVLYRVSDEWVQAWYQWRDDQLKKAMKEWLASLPLTIREDVPDKHTF